MDELNRQVAEMVDPKWTWAWKSKPVKGGGRCCWCDGDGQHNKQRMFHAEGQKCEWCHGTGIKPDEPAEPLDFLHDAHAAWMLLEHITQQHDVKIEIQTINDDTVEVYRVTLRDALHDEYEANHGDIKAALVNAVLAARKGEG